MALFQLITGLGFQLNGEGQKIMVIIGMCQYFRRSFYPFFHLR